VKSFKLSSLFLPRFSLSQAYLWEQGFPGVLNKLCLCLQIINYILDEWLYLIPGIEGFLKCMSNSLIIGIIRNKNCGIVSGFLIIDCLSRWWYFGYTAKETTTVILISGISCTGKTVMAQYCLKRILYKKEIPNETTYYRKRFA
jgi:hypothetical protein